MIQSPTQGDRPDCSPHGAPAPDAEVAEYQSLSVQAVLSLALGVLGLAALLEPMVGVVALAGLALGVAARWRIARSDGALGGRRLATAGLLLSTFSVAAVPVEWFAYRHLVRREAVAFAQEWFDLLAANQPQKAYQLTLEPHLRRPLDEQLWDYYRRTPDAYQDLQSYVSLPVIQRLLTLGGSSRAELYRVEYEERMADRDVAVLVFAVRGTTAEEQSPLTVRLTLERLRLASRSAERFRLGRAHWLLMNAKQCEPAPAT